MRKKLTAKTRLALLKFIFTAFQKNLDAEKLRLAEIEEETSKFKKIRCPLCKWQPNAASRWCCSDCGAPEYFYDGCYMMWNTFETGGKCPGCDHQWRHTSCLLCAAFSPHEDWYESD